MKPYTDYTVIHLTLTRESVFDLLVKKETIRAIYGSIDSKKSQGD